MVESYRKKADAYDRTVKAFDLFAWAGFDLSGWRRQAVDALKLSPGGSVVDIGCGTGLNFPLLRQAVGPDGRITGVDLSAEMLALARQSVEADNRETVDLVCMDAAQYEFPGQVDAILSTFALTLVPDCGRVIANAARALKPGSRLVVLDMAWPRAFPLWWRHVLFFLRSYGVTLETLHRRPWNTVQQAMQSQLKDFLVNRYWYGFFYLACGQK